VCQVAMRYSERETREGRNTVAKGPRFRKMKNPCFRSIKVAKVGFVEYLKVHHDGHHQSSSHESSATRPHIQEEGRISKRVIPLDERRQESISQNSTNTR
jgi:hypothetical protein